MLNLSELVLLAFAGYRATQLAVHDTILDPARNALFSWHSRKIDSPVRSATVQLISCPYCMGWWIAGVLLAVWLLVTGQFDQAPLLVHGVEWFAVAGAAVLLNRLDDTLSEVGQ
ncbi:DUF1360 domain-containing protein [Streptomyces sp. ME02-6987-2C]|uniref:DUF1360 domain-containing protein n=1 Tax=unclassified Streptomyces TaxID=2593676 RepID=UPI0029B02D61|nr:MULTISPECIES: DUF1360 domain-containing protein [unclassified Streptomyces]MDX3345901.1 DUF1360 domain-containing protein [Streptomyces sp. ME02-6979A]MDX3365095.1 DUF1360 domain-containing protein [Streptomyces sp. ME02-6987-2C]MDX3404849.1 DUF1360 domain-containing protein [Streptomyces sp. ME02-6977A]MDX3421667.1 DUF1360 domain-containing protein [Streptomyces sp. ME02-6985-2c]